MTDPPRVPKPPEEARPRLTHQDVADRLARLIAEPPPTTLSPGAMCYRMSGPPDRVEYICPTCAERTLYPNRAKSPWWKVGTDSALIQLLDRDLPAMRRLIANIQGIDARLDESRLCAACSPDAKDCAVGLEVRFPDWPRSHVVWGVSLADVKLVSEFAAGGNVHDDAFGSSSPLKDHAKRLRVLLGLAPPRR